MKKKTAVFVLVLALCISLNFSLAMTKIGYSGIDDNVCVDTTDDNQYYDPASDMYFDTTNADPDFDPLSSFDDEILQALNDADPEARVDYDPITGTVTISDQDDFSGPPILQTDGYVPDSGNG